MLYLYGYVLFLAQLFLVSQLFQRITTTNSDFSSTKSGSFRQIATNQRLEGKVLVSKRLVSRIGCSIACVTSPLCRNYNFLETSLDVKNCELIQTSYNSSSLVDSAGWNVYEAKLVTNAYGLLSGRCKKISHKRKEVSESNLICVDQCNVSSAVPCIATSNIARGKDTSQSTTSHHSSAVAVDGGTSGNWYDGTCSHTHEQTPYPWWRVDLGGIALVESIRIYNRRDCCSERLSNFGITIGYSPNRTENEICQSGQSLAWKPYGTYKCAGSSYGRYIHIFLDKKAGTLTLCEVIVYGVMLDRIV